MQSQLRYAGHIVCMKDHCLPKKLLNSELSQGKFSQRGQRKCFKDTLKVSMKSFGVVLHCLEYLAQDRDKWREVVKRGVKPEETQRLSCVGNLEKALPHQPLPPPFLVLTAQHSSTHRLIPLTTCALTDVFFIHNVNQMVLIDYDGQRRRNLLKHNTHNIYIYIY